MRSIRRMAPTGLLKASGGDRSINDVTVCPAPSTLMLVEEGSRFNLAR